MYPSSTIKYDDKLCKLKSFEMRPFSLPHIGSKLSETNGIIFIMESHYIDPDSFNYQKDKNNLKIEAPELFYNIKAEGLTQGFKDILNTRQIIRDSESPDPKIAKGKSVYRKLASVVKEGFKLDNLKESSALDHIAVYNFFQRPSYKPSASIKLCQKDKVVAYENLMHILNIIKIQKIIFTSAKAYDSFIKMDNLNNRLIQNGQKVFRGTHPRVWGNTCAYKKDITWKQWVINRIKNQP